MQLADLTCVLDEIAPTRLAEAWDNVGLIVGDPAQPVSKVMLTIDYTPEVAGEAAGEACDVIVAYHPPLFEAVKRVVAPSAVFDAIRRGVALYSPHTALDVADGGTNDMLADALGLPTDRRTPLRLVHETKSNQHKLVTFVPEKDVERVSQALFDAGAGRIGDYTSCSFQSMGTGTFFGEAGTNPTVGQSGRLELAPEVRVETVVPIAKVAAVIRALRKSHPYEEPAFDLQQLAAPPEGLGLGRIGEFEKPVPRTELIERVKRELELPHVLVSGPTDGNALRAAACAGACGDLLNDAIAQRADLYLTGEMRHHDALKAAARGMTVVCTLHSNSERAVLKRLKTRLEELLPQLPVILSRKDRDPFQVR
jgi:dinuclear metal center YbgI/SA1388 family protein